MTSEFLRANRTDGTCNVSRPNGRSDFQQNIYIVNPVGIKARVEDIRIIERYASVIDEWRIEACQHISVPSAYIRTRINEKVTVSPSLTVRSLQGPTNEKAVLECIIRIEVQSNYLKQIYIPLWLVGDITQRIVAVRLSVLPFT